MNLSRNGSASCSVWRAASPPRSRRKHRIRSAEIPCSAAPSASAFLPQHPEVGVIRVEEGLQAVELVPGPQLGHVGAGQGHLVAGRQADQQLRLERAFDMNVQLSNRQHASPFPRPDPGTDECVFIVASYHVGGHGYRVAPVRYRHSRFVDGVHGRMLHVTYRRFHRLQRGR